MRKLVPNWMLKDYDCTCRAGRIFLICWTVLFVVGWIGMTVYQLSIGHYMDAGAELPIFIFLFLLKGLYPFVLASAARKRGGDFGGWFTGGVLLGFLITGLIYLARWSWKPVLLQYSEHPEDVVIVAEGKRLGLISPDNTLASDEEIAARYGSHVKVDS